MADSFWLYFTVYMSIFVLIAIIYVAVTQRRLQRLLRNTELAREHMAAALKQKEQKASQASAKKTPRAAVMLEQDVLGSRLLFNRAVSQYNSLVKSPISGTVARIFGHEAKEFIDIE